MARILIVTIMCSWMASVRAGKLEAQPHSFNYSLISKQARENSDTTIKPATTSAIMLHGLVGQAVFFGIFLGMHGERFFDRNFSDDSAHAAAAFAPGLAWLFSAVAIDLWGNSVGLGDRSFWVPFLGGLGGMIVFLPIVSGLAEAASTPVKVLSLFTIPLAETLAYYYWPEQKSDASSNLRFSPYISNGAAGVTIIGNLR